MSTGTGALQTTYPGQKRADKQTFSRRILLTKKDRNRPVKMTDFTRVFKPTPLRLNYRLISTIQYLQRLFIHKKITPARLACLCYIKRDNLLRRRRLRRLFRALTALTLNHAREITTKKNTFVITRI